MMALSVIIITLVLPKQARFRFEYEKWKIWMQKDLVSPYSFAIRKTNAEIEEDRKDILKSILPVYQNSEEVILRSLENFNTEFETKWPSSGVVNSISTTGVLTTSVPLNSFWTSLDVGF